MKRSSVFRLLLTLASCFLLIIEDGCKGEGSFFSSTEGVVIYDVSFPYIENSLLLELYPKEMRLEFWGHQFHTSLKSAYGVVSTDMLIDNKEKTYDQMLKSFGDKYVLHLEDEKIKEWVEQYPKVRIVPTDITDTIAGYVCQKSMAYFISDSIPPIEIYTTHALKIPASNWWNQFHEVDGFLMGYEIEQYGKRMRVRGREVKFQKIDRTHFTIPDNYKPVGIAGMQYQIQSLLNNFTN